VKIFFRVDSSAKIGSGHVMRCLTLAEALCKKGAYVKFISRDHPGNINHLIIKAGFQVNILNQPKLKSKKVKNEYENWLGISEIIDAQETIKEIKNQEPDWLIVDHYSLSEKWEKELRQYVKKIFIIDDIANRKHDCDLILDQNWFKNMETRYKSFVPVTCIGLLGPKYALLRPEFAYFRKKFNPRNEIVKRVFVFFGGSDPHNLTSMTIKALSNPELAHLKVEVVIGDNNPHEDEILNLIKSIKNINFHKQVSNIASIMSKTDFSIGGGGVNLWEKVCLGLPSMVISLSENQKVQLSDLKNEEIIHFIGDVSIVNTDIIKKNILFFCKNFSILKKQTNKIKKIVNGNGVNIVTDFLISDMSNLQWELRNAVKHDMKLYWVWANDSKVRENALTKKIITWNEHVKWFKNKLLNSKSILFLIFVEKVPVGQVRFEIEKEFARIDFSIAKQFRGRKIAKQMLNKSVNKFWENNTLSVLGEVLPQNISSSKIFESLGFKLKIKNKNLIYTKEIKKANEINA
jgi:UDP-2,4-diacetamido-2,4,6-trideoxy-beta-L-altropyranose hydrolase